MVWRVGRHVGRTIYLQKGPEPSDEDQLIGTMDTVELARRAVDSANAMTPAPTPSHHNVDLEKLRMVTELDTAMHGETVARDASPQEVWYDLLAEVKMLQDQVSANASRGNLEKDLARDLNYWGADGDLGIPDFILANLLIRQLYNLKTVQDSVRKYNSGGEATVVAPRKLWSAKRPSQYDGPVPYRDEEYGPE